MSIEEMIEVESTERDCRIRVHDHKSTDQAFASINRSVSIEVAGYGSSNAPEYNVSPHRVSLWVSASELSSLHRAIGKQLELINEEQGS